MEPIQLALLGQNIVNSCIAQELVEQEVLKHHLGNTVYRRLKI